jgi:hypothetical protein
MQCERPQKIPTTRAGDQVRRLVEWYEEHKPEAGQRILVALGPKQLAKELGLIYAEGQREFIYKGRTLVATGHD